MAAVSWVPAFIIFFSSVSVLTILLILYALHIKKK